jgi:hypothetical protein
MARDQDNSALRQTLQETAFSSLAKTDPQRAADLWTSESLAAGHGLGRMPEIVKNLAWAQGLPEALRFLSRLPDQLEVDAKGVTAALAPRIGSPRLTEEVMQMPAGQQRTALLQEAFRRLAQDGEIAAVQRLAGSLPSGLEKNAVIQSTATALLSQDPDGSVKMLRQMEDGATRIDGVLRQWLTDHRASARRWINASTLLSLSEKQNLLATPQ